MCEEAFVAVKKYLRQQGVRSSFGRAVLSSLFCLEMKLQHTATMLFTTLEHGLMQCATFHFYCHVQNFGDNACDIRALTSKLLHE